MFKDYIWDFDGTLYDTYPVMLEGYMKTLENFKVDADSQEVYKILKESSSKKVAERYELEFEPFTDFFHAWEAADTRVPNSFKGAKEVLEAVVANGGKNYILTHRKVGSTKELLAAEGLLDLVVEIVGPDNNFPRKPDPTSLLYLVDKYGMDQAQTAMIGDRTMDVLAGEAAGVKTVFFDIDYLLEGIKADAVIHSMTDLLQLITTKD